MWLACEYRVNANRSSPVKARSGRGETSLCLAQVVEHHRSNQGRRSRAVGRSGLQVCQGLNTDAGDQRWVQALGVVTDCRGTSLGNLCAYLCRANANTGEALGLVGGNRIGYNRLLGGGDGRSLPATNPLTEVTEGVTPRIGAMVAFGWSTGAAAGAATT